MTEIFFTKTITALQDAIEELRLQGTEIARLRAALIAIAAMPDEDDEWDGRDKFREVRAMAQNAMAHTKRPTAKECD